MNWFTTISLAIALGVDALAVATAVAAGGKGAEPRAVFRLSFHFGLFQFLMPVAGWGLGYTVAEHIRDTDHWIAFGLLCLVGLRMVAGYFRTESDRNGVDDPTRGWSLVLLSIATSVDALAVGLSLAFLNVGIWLPSVVIGLVASAMTLTGVWFGKVLSARFGKTMELIGGLILIAIGVKILIEHLG